MTRSNIYIVDEGIGQANNLIYVPMCILLNRNAYRIIRETDIETYNEQYQRVKEKLKQIQRQHDENE